MRSASRPTSPWGGAGAARGAPRGGGRAARSAARRGGARHRHRGGAQHVPRRREDRHGAARGERAVRPRTVHRVVRGALPRRPPPARAGREARQSAQGQLLRGAGSGAPGARRHRHGDAGGRARAASPRVPRGAQGMGRRGAHVAGGGRQRGAGFPRHAVRGRSAARRRPAGDPAAQASAMSRLPDIVTALERAQLLVGTPDLHTWPAITGLTADSRKVAPGMLYCAVRGSLEDGHRFLAAARERGAVAALVEREQPVELPQVLVRDGRRAAATAAAAWYGTPAAKLDLVGVTGTNGKTTSVTLARHVLSALEPTGSIGTLGAFDPAGSSVPSEAGNLTTPGPIDLQATLAALVERGARGAAMEVSSHSLDPGRAAWLVFCPPIFTDLPLSHLDYHKTVDDYFHAKAKLIGYLAPDGLEVVNADDPAWQRLRRAHRRVAFGERGGEVTARRIALDAAGARFELVTPTGSAPVQLPLL